MNYKWGGKFHCVRYGQDMSGETHICYFCGTTLDLKTGGSQACPSCHFEKCPGCGICFCNAKPEVQVAARVLREKYCCRPEPYVHGIYEGDRWLLDYVPSFEAALNYCRAQYQPTLWNKI